MQKLNLKASSAETATGQSVATFPAKYASLAAKLIMTNADAAVGDTLDVSIQTRLDGTNWFDVLAFTQVLGNGDDDLVHIGKINGELAETMFEKDTALAAGNVRNIIGPELRVSWVIAGATPSFTFSVVALTLP